jgi:hypothetical protein
MDERIKGKLHDVLFYITLVGDNNDKVHIQSKHSSVWPHMDFWTKEKQICGLDVRFEGRSITSRGIPVNK